MITPSAGFIDLSTSFFFGVIGALGPPLPPYPILSLTMLPVIRQALRFKFTKTAERIRWVDCGDVFATHCVGGFLATIMTGIFARRSVAFYDGETAIRGGAVFDGNWSQVPIQAVEAVIGLTWSFVVTFAIVAIIDLVPGCEVLAEDAMVVQGMERAEMADESLWEGSWAGEEGYHPFRKNAVMLE